MAKSYISINDAFWCIALHRFGAAVRTIRCGIFYMPASSKDSFHSRICHAGACFTSYSSSRLPAAVPATDPNANHGCFCPAGLASTVQRAARIMVPAQLLHFLPASYLLLPSCRCPPLTCISVSVCLTPCTALCCIQHVQSFLDD